MFRPRVIPALLLKGQGLVKTVQFKNPRYIGDPINAVRIFNDLEVDELMLLDIMATRENRCISTEIVKQVGDEAYMPFAVGGGITTLAQAVALISAGAEKVVINSAFARNPAFIKELAAELGNQSVVVSLDVKKNWLGKYEVYSAGGSTKSKSALTDLVRQAQDSGAGELLLNSIGHEGLMKGYDLELIRSVSSVVQIPVVACGGAGSIKHLREAADAGAHALAAGSLFVYHGPRNAVLVNYPEKEDLINNFR